MTAQDFISRLDRVRERGHGRWTARCPGHDDRNPSLTVKEGEHAIMVKCWAHCTLEEITRAMHIRITDLFFDSDLDPRWQRGEQQRRDIERTRRERENFVAGLKIDAQREASQLITSTRNVCIDSWTNDELHTILNKLADAYDLVEYDNE